MSSDANPGVVSTSNGSEIDFSIEEVQGERYIVLESEAFGGGLIDFTPEQFHEFISACLSTMHLAQTQHFTVNDLAVTAAATLLRVVSG